MTAQLCEDNTKKAKKYVYVARELWQHDCLFNDVEELIGVYQTKDAVVKAILAKFEDFYDWYEDSEYYADHDALREEERGNLLIEIARFEHYGENIDYGHEWYDYGIKVDKVEVQ